MANAIRGINKKEGRSIGGLPFYSNTGYHAINLFGGHHTRPLRGGHRPSGDFDTRLLHGEHRPSAEYDTRPLRGGHRPSGLRLRESFIIHHNEIWLYKGEIDPSFGQSADKDFGQSKLGYIGGLVKSAPIPPYRRAM